METIIKKGAKKNSINQILKKILSIKGIDAYKYCGIIKLKQDPLLIQKKLRHEWK
jgi:hypothetical protein